MRTPISIFLTVLVVALCGCVAPRPDVKTAGVFKSKEGRHVLLTPDGKLYKSESAVAGDRLSFIGILSSSRKKPHEVFVTTPSSGTWEWMGVTLVFSQDFTKFDVFGYELRVKPTKRPQSSYERIY